MDTSLLQWLEKEPFTLSLSASFLGFYSHSGALRALAEAGLQPARITGCSSGAIVASLYASGLCALTAIPPLLFKLRSRDILVPPWRRFPLACIMGGGGLCRIRTDVLSAASPVRRLEASPRCPVAISTFCHKEVVIHTSGDAAQVVAASCSVPRLMQPVRLPDGPGGAWRRHSDGFEGDFLAIASCEAGERTLIVDLHTKHQFDALRDQHLLEEQQKRWQQGDHRKLRRGVRVSLKGLPAVMPWAMARAGPLAHEEAYALMKEALSARRSAWGNEDAVEAYAHS